MGQPNTQPGCLAACLNGHQGNPQASCFSQRPGNRRTQDEGDGNLLGVSVKVLGQLLKQPLLVVQEGDPAEHSRTLQQRFQPGRGKLHHGRRVRSRPFSRWPVGTFKFLVEPLLGTKTTVGLGPAAFHRLATRGCSSSQKHR